MKPATRKEEKSKHLRTLLMDDPPEDTGGVVEKKDKVRINFPLN